MSCITENTVVIRMGATDRIIADLNEYGCSGINEVFMNDKIEIILFDCNGDSPWDIVNSDKLKAKVDDILAIETNYGDGDSYWTRVWTDKYGLSEYDGEILDWLHDNLELNEYYTVKDLIRYTF